MAQEHFYPLRVRPDNNVGRVGNERRLEEADDVLTTFWTELYVAAKDGTLESEEEFHPIPVEES